MDFQAKTRRLSPAREEAAKELSRVQAELQKALALVLSKKN
jgi:hypothetical protein